ncbi:uncharacterized protein LOC119558551 [Drosophila subpulchrella]|uniref:uncharacterized protein LOC119550339 n=1 Tax=Drosophila subpulchrella TaxID=1486046 RepID=UPI0018A172BC|nr:uncharacterized protein LOC119550339 [Drosophila subpulchrella]XP_037727948.1 uncharacterized protein LOC119558551 [Drosophila subpulchrella]
MLPTWLTEEYLEQRLRTYYKDDQLKVLKILAKPATEKGQNYMSLMTRIHVDYQQSDGLVQKRSYIVKQALSENVPQAKVFVEYDVYNREMDMYEFVLPKMKELLQEAGLKGKIAADAVAVDREYSTMILEDLSQYNYVNADRVKQLDLAHTKLTLEMLAKFHAASIILIQRHPKLLSKCFNTHFFSRDKEGYTEVYQGVFRAFLRFIDEQPDLKRSYGDKLEKLHNFIMEYGARVFEVNEEELQTLIHGDCWTTNIMFQYDNAGNPRKAVAIDFQFSNCTSPAIDLHHFFTVSLREEFQDMESELVDKYYSDLKANLEKLSYTGLFPSLTEFRLQFERRRFMTLLSHLFKPVIIYNGDEVTSDFSSLYKETEEGLRFQKSIHASDIVIRSSTRLLAILDGKGLLDLQ